MCTDVVARNLYEFPTPQVRRRSDPGKTFRCQDNFSEQDCLIWKAFDELGSFDDFTFSYAATILSSAILADWTKAGVLIAGSSSETLGPIHLSALTNFSRLHSYHFYPFPDHMRHR